MPRYRIETNYETATGSGTAIVEIEGTDQERAIETAHALLRQDRRRRIMKIDGGSAEEITPHEDRFTPG